MSVSHESHVIDVRNLPSNREYFIIFETFRKLQIGETMHVIHDHDPRPFYFQFDCEFRGYYHCYYEEEGPDIWQISITKTLKI